ncbi:MAG: GNAT family N-acetyltransferase [Alteromonadaceae bacterium]|nr:MAG: GNAT family N-acetyltransferase [Alteromonadaceae bacterium]
MHSWRKTTGKHSLFDPIISQLARLTLGYRCNKIAKHFDEFLSPHLAQTPLQRNACFCIRHQVYCNELGILDIKQEPLESDEYDNHAYHALVMHKPTQVYAGTVRVVHSPSSKRKLPLEKHFLKHILPGKAHPEDFPRDSICEISRLAVTSNFRRRFSDKFCGAATGAINEAISFETKPVTNSANELRRFPLVTTGLYLSAASIVLQNKVPHCFALMEPLLARNLANINIKFEQISPIINFKGQRAIFYLNANNLAASLTSELNQLLQHVDTVLFKGSSNSALQ